MMTDLCDVCGTLGASAWTHVPGHLCDPCAHRVTSVGSSFADAYCETCTEVLADDGTCENAACFFAVCDS